jgi:hypothetical protein
MKALRRLRLPAAFAMALTLMACASAPSTEASVFDTLARANDIHPVGCAGFEIKSCQSTTRTQRDQTCTCLPREALRQFAPH